MGFAVIYSNKRTNCSLFAFLPWYLTVVVYRTVICLALCVSYCVAVNLLNTNKKQYAFLKLQKWENTIRQHVSRASFSRWVPLGYFSFSGAYCLWRIVTKLLYAVRIVCGSVLKRSSVSPSVCLSVCLSVPSINSSSDVRRAAEFGRRLRISRTGYQATSVAVQPLSCCYATCGPRKFWSDCKEIQHKLTF